MRSRTCLPAHQRPVQSQPHGAAGRDSSSPFQFNFRVPDGVTSIDIGARATDLGGNTLQTFLGVTLPLTVPGIAAGCVFVFVLSIGNFITPDLLGGGRSIMVGNLIYDQFLSARDWPFGASLAFILIGIMMSLLVVQAWLVNRSAGRDG